MELWRPKILVQRGVFFTALAQGPFFIFGRLHLMTLVSSGDDTGVISLSFDNSFMWCEQFCLGGTFYFDDFYFIGNLRQKSINPLSHLNIANICWHYIYTCSIYQHTKFRTCMRNSTIFAIFHSTTLLSVMNNKWSAFEWHHATNKLLRTCTRLTLRALLY